ncbi:inositol-3-phosphate synthase [Thermithiobacillus tepidarius DSM 3134]|uniref:inositol-3-phosphate synthase n=1 Tax=Thermithiobacillus tepidarius TaxID=929 RepID=UPI000404DA2C|nr:inositol-3-phosphate synthase [Thermithiobacillus tepidarius]
MNELRSFEPHPTRVIAPAQGPLGVLLPGMGAVATTLVAGVHLINKRFAKPYGSLTQMQEIERDDGTAVPIRELVPLAALDDLVFGGWDIFPDNAYQTACAAGVLSREMLAPVRKEMERLRPWPGVFDQTYVRNLHGTHVKTGPSKMHLAEALMRDTEGFLGEHGLQRAVMLWCGSTETYLQPSPVHETLEAFEEGLKRNAPEISPSMIYAYAALMQGIPFGNGAPNLAVDVPALMALAERRGVAIAGKDLKTGQTLMKTILAPGLKARMLGLNGWFSSNILGNRDGEVLDDPGSFRTKELSKSSVLDGILQPARYPDLYGNYYHKVRIEYYPPRGDAKEGWDNIDIFGWLGQSMQIKVDFLCKDSILAAPVALDLILLLDLAQRAGLGGIQDWLSFYFKSPMTDAGVPAEHDLFVQHERLMERLRSLSASALLDYPQASPYESTKTAGV